MKRWIYLAPLAIAIFLPGCSCPSQIADLTSSSGDSTSGASATAKADCAQAAELRWAIADTQSSLNKLQQAPASSTPDEALNVGEESVGVAGFDPNTVNPTTITDISEAQQAAYDAITIDSWMTGWQQEAAQVHERAHADNFVDKIKSLGSWDRALAVYNRDNDYAREDELDAYQKQLDFLQSRLNSLGDSSKCDEAGYINAPCECRESIGYAIGMSCGATLKYPGGNCNSCLCKVKVNAQGVPQTSELYYRCCLSCWSEVKNYQPCATYDATRR